MKLSKRTPVVVIVALVLVMSLTLSAFAIDLSWNTSNGDYTYNFGNLTYSNGSATIRFDGNAYCANYYVAAQAQLQKQGFLGIWSNVGNAKSFTFTPESSRNKNYNTDAMGTYFTCDWANCTSGNYRIVLSSATTNRFVVVKLASLRFLY